MNKTVAILMAALITAIGIPSTVAAPENMAVEGSVDILACPGVVEVAAPDFSYGSVYTGVASTLPGTLSITNNVNGYDGEPGCTVPGTIDVTITIGDWNDAGLVTSYNPLPTELTIGSPTNIDLTLNVDASVLPGIYTQTIDIIF